MEVETEKGSAHAGFLSDGGLDARADDPEELGTGLGVEGSGELG